MVVEGVVPNSRASVGRTTLTILASMTDMMRAREAATIAQIRLGLGSPSVASVIETFLKFIRMLFPCKINESINSVSSSIVNLSHDRQILP